MERLILSAAPHIRSRASTRTIMGDVLIALLPSRGGLCGFLRPPRPAAGGGLRGQRRVVRVGDSKPSANARSPSAICPPPSPA